MRSDDWTPEIAGGDAGGDVWGDAGGISEITRGDTGGISGIFTSEAQYSNISDYMKRIRCESGMEFIRNTTPVFCACAPNHMSHGFNRTTTNGLHDTEEQYQNQTLPTLLPAVSDVDVDDIDEVAPTVYQNTVRLFNKGNQGKCEKLSVKTCDTVYAIPALSLNRGDITQKDMTYTSIKSCMNCFQDGESAETENELCAVESKLTFPRLRVHRHTTNYTEVTTLQNLLRDRGSSLSTVNDTSEHLMQKI